MSIPASVIADARAVAAALLPDTCDVSRPGAPAYGAAGDETVVWAPVLTGVACLVRPAGAGDERLVAQGVATIAAWVVHLADGTDVRAGDRVTAAVAGATRVLEVLPPTGPSSYELLRAVGCSEIA